MDIDMGVLKLMESEREIPFDDLVLIIEQAILVAYEKHMGLSDNRGQRLDPDAPRERVELDKKRIRPMISAELPLTRPSRSSTSDCVTSETTASSVTIEAKKATSSLV